VGSGVVSSSGCAIWELYNYFGYFILKYFFWNWEDEDE
jgi:hypothetical protein